MDILIAILITFSALIFSVLKGIFVGYSLILCLFLFVFISCKRGFPLKNIIKMFFNGGASSYIVLSIFVLIGCITSIWLASGTVPSIIYYGVKYMNPNLFILYSFLITCVVSYLLGSALGTVSTIGIALILIAKSGGVDINIVAGSIISGAYFGDRCSPMASSANLVANLTETNLYINIKNMFKTSIVPFILSVFIYFLLSLQSPLSFVQNQMDTEIVKIFQINWIMLLPAIIILVLSLFKVNVKWSMILSIICASIIAMIFQHYKFNEVIRFLVFGFDLNSDSFLKSILKGGGIISMWKASLVVFISCGLSGIFDGTSMLEPIKSVLNKATTSFSLFIYTLVTSVLTGAFGCNQSIAIVLTHNIMNKTYSKKNTDNYKLAIDLENSGVLLSALIPWNIAAFVPTTAMEVSNTGFIPYAFYLYLVPLFNILYLKISQSKQNKVSMGNCKY